MNHFQMNKTDSMHVFYVWQACKHAQWARIIKVAIWGELIVCLKKIKIINIFLKLFEWKEPVCVCGVKKNFQKNFS